MLRQTCSDGGARLLLRFCSESNLNKNKLAQTFSEVSNLFPLGKSLTKTLHRSRQGAHAGLASVLEALPESVGFPCEGELRL